MAKMATREAYGKALAELAKENKKILVLDADLSADRSVISEELSMLPLSVPAVERKQPYIENIAKRYIRQSTDSCIHTLIFLNMRIFRERDSRMLQNG